VKILQQLELDNLVQQEVNLPDLELLGKELQHLKLALLWFHLNLDHLEAEGGELECQLQKRLEKWQRLHFQSTLISLAVATTKMSECNVGVSATHILSLLLLD
jgi:hypothetical protein